MTTEGRGNLVRWLFACKRSRMTKRASSFASRFFLTGSLFICGAASYAAEGNVTLIELGPSKVQKVLQEKPHADEFRSFREKLVREFDIGSTRTCASDFHEHHYYEALRSNAEHSEWIVSAVQSAYDDRAHLEDLLSYLVYSEELIHQSEAHVSITLTKLLANADSRWLSFRAKLEEDVDFIAERASEFNRRERILERVIAHVRQSNPDVWYQPGLLPALRDRDALASPVTAIYLQLTEHHKSDVAWYSKIKNSMRKTLLAEFSADEV